MRANMELSADERAFLRQVRQVVTEVEDAVYRNDPDSFLRTMESLPEGAIGPHCRSECFTLLQYALRWLAEMSRQGNERASNQLMRLIEEYPWLCTMASEGG
jgi:hypothetical protein